MADASDSKSDAGNSVWVQVPSPALDEACSTMHALPEFPAHSDLQEYWQQFHHSLFINI